MKKYIQTMLGFILFATFSIGSYSQTTIPDIRVQNCLERRAERCAKRL